MLFGSFRLVNTELCLLIELVHRDVRGLRHSGEGVVCNNSTSECDDDTVVIPDEDDDDPDDALLDDMTTIVMMATVRMSMSKTMNNAMRRFCWLPQSTILNVVCATSGAPFNQHF